MQRVPLPPPHHPADVPTGTDIDALDAPPTFADSPTPMHDEDVVDPIPDDDVIDPIPDDDRIDPIPPDW